MKLNHENLKGFYTALVTPFNNKKVDFPSLKKLIEWQIKGGINGLVINGTTAESPTLSEDEVQSIFKFIKDIVGQSIPLVVGTGSNSTSKTVEITKKAQDWGADGALVVVPYYNKPSQNGLIQHFQEVSNNCSLPIIAYNVPGRTITSMNVNTIHEVAKLKNIIGIKEASGDLKFDSEMIQKLNTLSEKKFNILSGDDPTFLDFISLGGHGVISVMSNLFPKKSTFWYNNFNNNESLTKKDFNNYLELIKIMYCEANPIPVKWMLYQQGIIQSPELRLPLTTLDSKFHDPIKKLLNECEIN